MKSFDKIDLKIIIRNTKPLSNCVFVICMSTFLYWFSTEVVAEHFIRTIILTEVR